MESIAYCSPAHGYSFQATLLAHFSIQIGTNHAIKKEAVASLEGGHLLAFGVSEREHGSDLLGNEFTLTQTGEDHFVATGAKFYIGNVNVASIIAILARRKDPRTNGHVRRFPFALFALRPARSEVISGLRKIRTFGVRAGYVGAFEVKDHPVEACDIIAEGRDAWDAVFGAVTLGKFFLGFGSIGMCEHAFSEAAEHLRKRMLYGKSVLSMPHIQSLMAQAYARLCGMKLYAFRALDYVHAATDADRRYLLFTAVQKARVSAEGVKVMALMLECVGAKGFEADTYFEMALRDVQLIPGLEGSTHINLAATAQFAQRYFGGRRSNLQRPASLIASQGPADENLFLFRARTNAIHSITFPAFLDAYRPLWAIGNVRLFVRQAKAFEIASRRIRLNAEFLTDMHITLAAGHCLATIVYAQLIAENCVLCDVPQQLVAAIFHTLVADMTTACLCLASVPGLECLSSSCVADMIVIPRTSGGDWEFVAERVAGA